MRKMERERKQQMIERERESNRYNREREKAIDDREREREDSRKRDGKQLELIFYRYRYLASSVVPCLKNLRFFGTSH